MMKKIIGSVFCSLFILIIFSNIAAQERKITEQEMNAAGKGWTFKGKAYRLKKTSKSFIKTDGKINNFFTEVTEYSASGDSHTITEWGRSLENIQRHESFIIGKTTYDLHPSGKWRVGEVKFESEERRAQRVAEYNATERITEHFYKGKAMLNGQEADLYESKTIEKSKRNGREFVTVIISKSWYNKDGMLLKNERTTDNEMGNSYSVFEFELDPAIKIEAPVK